MDTLAQILFHQLAAGGTHLACVARVNPYHLASSICSFVRSELDELTPGRIRNRLGEAMVLHHAPDVQLLKDDQAEPVNQLPAFLVREVPAQIPNALMNASHNTSLRRSLRASIPGCAQFPLGACKPTFLGPKESRIGNMLAVGARGEPVKAAIDTGHLRGHRQYLRFSLYGKAGEPFAGCAPRNIQRLYCSFDGPMEFNFNVANFGQSELVALDAKSSLRIGQAVVPETRPKAREPRLLTRLATTKEAVEGSIESCQNFLQNLRMHALELVANLFDLRQLNRLTLIAYGFPFHSPRIAALLKRSIVQFAAKSKLGFKASLLRSARIESESESFPQLFPPLVFHVFLDRFQGRTANRYHQVRRAPQVPIPHSVAQRRECLEHSARRDALEAVDDLGNLVFWRRLENNVYVVNLRLNGYQIKPALLAQISKDLFAFVAYLPGHHGTPVFNAPYKVILKLIDRMTAGLKVILQLAIVASNPIVETTGIAPVYRTISVEQPIAAPRRQIHPRPEVRSLLCHGDKMSPAEFLNYVLTFSVLFGRFSV